jgi:hypothetical protein
VIVDQRDQPVPEVLVGLDAIERGGSTKTWTFSDAEGKFALHGDTVEKTVGLMLVKIGFAHVYLHDVSLGSTGVRLVIRRSGTIAGSVALPRDAALGELLVDLREEDGPGNQCCTSVGEDGAFLIEDLQPGRWRVSISPRGSSGALAVVDDVVVRDASTTRIGPIALGEPIYTHVLRVRDTGTHEPLSGRYDIDPPLGDEPDAGPDEPAEFRVMNRTMRRMTQTFEGGELRLVSKQAELDVTLFIEGHRTVKVHSTGDAAEVMVDSGIPIRLRLRGKLPDIPAPWCLKVS